MRVEEIRLKQQNIFGKIISSLYSIPFRLCFYLQIHIILFSLYLDDFFFMVFV